MDNIGKRNVTLDIQMSQECNKQSQPEYMMFNSLHYFFSCNRKLLFLIIPSVMVPGDFQIGPCGQPPLVLYFDGSFIMVVFYHGSFIMVATKRHISEAQTRSKQALFLAQTLSLFLLKRLKAIRESRFKSLKKLRAKFTDQIFISPKPLGKDKLFWQNMSRA